MKKLTGTILIIAVFVLGLGIGCYIKSKNNIAIVDVMEIVNKSAQVEALKNEQATKTQELMEWLQNAQSEVKKEKDTKKQEELLKKYNEEFTQKREELSKQYNDELQKIDADITATIGKIAEDKGYSVVVAKGLVMFGGKDITEDVAKSIK